MHFGLRKYALLASFVVLLISTPTTTWSHGTSYGKLTLDHPYAVLTQDPLGASVYFRELANRGSQTYRITGAQSHVAGQVRLQTETHTPEHVIQWITIQTITIEPKTSKRFRHNDDQGYRILLTDLQQPLKNGDTFDLTLNFDDGGHQTVNVWVQAPRVGKKTHTH